MTTASCCRIMRPPTFCRAAADSRATSINPTTPTQELRNFSRSCPGELRTDGEPTAGLFLQLPLQFAYEGRQPGPALALQPLGIQDRLHLGKRPVDIVIDHDVIIFRPVCLLYTSDA